MSVIFFRCIEAMYGTSPHVVEWSISNYCGYYSSMVRIPEEIISVKSFVYISFRQVRV
jgi:hypothetical protein